MVIPAKAGLRRQDAEANIGYASGPSGERHDVVRNPVKPVHPELVEGFIKYKEWFDRLIMNGIYFTRFPPARE